MRVDETRRAQILISQMRNQEGQVLALAFKPATGNTAHLASNQARTAIEIVQAKAVFNESLAKLDALGNSGAPTKIQTLIQSDFKFLDRISVLVGRDNSRKAALELGKSESPGGTRARLAEAFDQADADYDAKASRSRIVALFGTAGSIILLLIAFSLTYHHSARARQRSHADATTDALTELGNRRKLFADLERSVASLDDENTLTLGIFDLDGFKAYNDTFGHPAGDALLARLGRAARRSDRPAAASPTGSAATSSWSSTERRRNGERVTQLAQKALYRGGHRLRGRPARSARHPCTPGSSPKPALPLHHQRLYIIKRMAHA